MRKFALKLSVFSILVTAAIVLLLEFCGGYVDYFYPKVSSPRQTSLIIGDSRSVEGIRPAIIDQKLSHDFNLPMFNYSFTIAQATYGDCYLESIKKKLEPDSGNGLFIVSVNPWMFLKRDGDDYANGKFFEADSPPHNLNFPSLRYNPEHFFKNYEFVHFSTVFTRAGKTHRDGWFEDRKVSNDPKVRSELEHGQVKLYTGMGKRYQVSQYRLNKFKETIAYLKQKGTVVVVRMPVNESILDIERRLRPDFDRDIESITQSAKVPYVNYTKTPNGFSTFDGVHLDIDASASFTKQLCDSILKYKQR